MAEALTRVAAFTGGVDIASARFRVRAYLPYMAGTGVALTEYASHAGQYPPRGLWRRPGWAGCRVGEALVDAVRSRRSDLVLFQRELLSTFVTVEPLFRRPRVLDVDDAIWLHPRGAFALKLARHCDAIICGNPYLADYFSRSKRPVFILPTGVDVARFMPRTSAGGARLLIGWSGTSGNLGFLEALDRPLAIVLKMHADARLRVVCDRPPEFKEIPREKIDYVRWSADVEVAALQDLTVGLMPLEDNPWTRGKCAFKMLTYMGCGVPVVVSPVGMNGTVLAQERVGFAARSDGEWVEALDVLLRDRDMAARMGRTGRALVERFYSLAKLAPRFAKILKEVAEANR